MTERLVRQALLLVDEAEILQRIELNATDAARLCGVSSRQLSYWTSKGLVQATDSHPRRYTLQALRKARLIKRHLNDGYSLDRAIRLIAALPVGAPAGFSIDEFRNLVEQAIRGLEAELLQRREHLTTDILLMRLANRQRELNTRGARQRLAARDPDAEQAHAAIERAVDALNEALSHLTAVSTGHISSS